MLPGTTLQSGGQSLQSTVHDLNVELITPVNPIFPQNKFNQLACDKKYCTNLERFRDSTNNTQVESPPSIWTRSVTSIRKTLSPCFCPSNSSPHIAPMTIAAPLASGDSPTEICENTPHSKSTPPLSVMTNLYGNDRSNTKSAPLSENSCSRPLNSPITQITPCNNPITQVSSVGGLATVNLIPPGWKRSDKILLGPPTPEDTHKKCLVLDLDETLVHSSFKLVTQADFVIPINIDGQTHNVCVLKRPGLDEFMRCMGERFEVVIFTASLAKYADPLLDMLDKHKVVKHRLFREACINHKGNYVKDLNMLGRDLKSVIIIDNSPMSYLFHRSNAIPISSWFNDPNDYELLELIPFLNDLDKVENVTLVLGDDESSENGR